MADHFRKYQRCDWGGPRWAKGPYGCPCCQRIHLGRNKAKKLSRKLAKAKLREESRQEIKKEQEG